MVEEEEEEGGDGGEADNDIIGDKVGVCSGIHSIFMCDGHGDGNPNSMG